MWLLYNNSNNNNNNYHQKIKKYNNKNSPTMFLISFCLFHFCTLFSSSANALSTSSFSSNNVLLRSNNNNVNKPTTVIKDLVKLPAHWSESILKQHLSEMKNAVQTNNVYNKEDSTTRGKSTPNYPLWAANIANERSPCTELLHPNGCHEENTAVAKAIADAEEAADKASLTDSNVSAIPQEVVCKEGQIPSAARTIAIGNLQAAHTRLKIALVDVMRYIREARDKLSAALNTCSGGGDWADKVVEQVKYVREYLYVAMQLIEKAHKILLEALQVAERSCKDDTLNLEIFLRRSHEALLKGWNNLREAYRGAMKGVSVSHFKSGGVIGDIIKKAQDSTAILMQDTAGLIDDAAKAAWGSVAGDGKKPPVVDKLTPRMMKKIAEQKALPILKGPAIKQYSRTGFAATSAFVCAQERELRWTPCFQDLCRHEQGTRQSGCMYGCFAVIAQSSQEDDDKMSPFRAHVRRLLGKKRIFAMNPLHRAMAAIAASTTIPMLNGAMLTLVQGEGKGIEPIYGNSDLTAARTQAVSVLDTKNAVNVACNQRATIDTAIKAAKNARSHEDLFNIVSNVINCKADDMDKAVIVNVDSHGCVHFCTSHVDTVLAHSCENKVAKETANDFLNTRKGWSRACVLSCKQRTSSETFQNAWGEHGGKIQMNPKPEKDTYGGGLPQGPLTVKHIHAGARWNVCNQTVCGGKTTLSRSGCIYGCRVMVLTGLPEKEDCNQYCDEVVDQVLADKDHLGAEANKFDPKSVVVADREAVWVMQCKRGCKLAANYYPPNHEIRYMYERGLGKNPIPPLDKDFIEQRRVMKIIANHDGYASLRRSANDKEGTKEGTSKIITDDPAEILKMKKEDELKYHLRNKDIIDDHKQFHLKGKDIILPGTKHNPVTGR